ncbi:SRPBCC domain-containing protein [Flavobacterium sp. DG2-3]|uniref:SRPBCC domain-containing protein n=1 Tax=Flavobacterium sp. DG2-3 TaxID=3068317 RepID=UPI00273E3C14|nr:SRPBCC domain-containing protein [Flavobacterium sp. DG2-3]MDP5201477.1 SRPBCC domain-containing protein [Flavobacterium sp. DG2-3]
MISVQCIINASIAKVWELWTLPEHIVNWNYPSEEWHTIAAENDLKINGQFKYTMQAKDKSATFDFEGIYTEIKVLSLIEYMLSDNRKGTILFEEHNGNVKLTEIFEPNLQDSEDMQKQWCQTVIDNFKIYAEHIKNNN